MDENQNKSNPGDRIMKTLGNEYTLVWKADVKSWQAWLAIGLVAGIAIGLTLAASRNGEVKSSAAAVGGPLAVQGQFIAVLSPNGGETWTTNAKEVVTWNAEGVQTVMIELVKGTKVARRIAFGVPAGDGSFEWTVSSGQPLGTDHKVRISSLQNRSMFDESDADFQIVKGSSGTGGNPPANTIVGDYTIDTPGKVIEGKTLALTGTVLVKADDVTLKNVTIRCEGPRGGRHAADGLRAVGVNRLRLYHVTLFRCGKDAIYLQDGSGHDLSEGRITDSGGAAIILDHVDNSTIVGWYLRSGVDIRNGSHHNRVVSVLVQGSQLIAPYHISADSYANQIVRSRSRDNNKAIDINSSENPNNLWHHVICDAIAGYAGCYLTQNRKGPNDYGNPEDFSPRTWTVCLPPSFGGNKCDHTSFEAAVNDPKFNDGDMVLIDSKQAPGWSAITISRPLWFVGNMWAQKGTYNPAMLEIGKGPLPGIMVEASGVRVQNLWVDGPPSISTGVTGTTLIDIRILDNTRRWKIMPY